MLGARQVGKTWLMQEFAKEAYSKSAYVNFEDNEMLKDLFAHDFDITRIVNSIQWSTGVSIDENTLIILDEIQEAHRGITALTQLLPFELFSKKFCLKISELGFEIV